MLAESALSPCISPSISSSGAAERTSPSAFLILRDDGVARLLEGADPELRRLVLGAGTLNVFRGKNTAHRVTPVKGATDRIIAVLTYYERPGARFTPEEQMGFYGRVA